MTGGEKDSEHAKAPPKPGLPAGRASRIDWRQVAVLYRRELRAALREKAIVVNSVVIPLFLYPFILWAGFTGILFVLGQTEGALSRVAVSGWPKDHPGLERSFKRDKQIQLVPVKGTFADLKKITNGTLDALVEFLPARGTNAAFPGNFRARVTYNQSKERSVTAQERVTDLVARYRAGWLDRQARSLGIGPARWERFGISTRNIASKKEMGAFLLSMLLPVMFVVMVAVGCFYPAVDATAGERERNTWETLMSTAANRWSIVTAKYLYVTTLGGLAGVLNLLAMILTIKPIFAPLVAKIGDVIQFTLPLSAAPVLVLAAVLLAGFVSAGMMIFAAFARTFKEGQAMITPFYLVVLLPILFLQSPGLKFSLPLACVPVANVTLMVRAAVSGSLAWAPVGVTFIVSLALIALCLGVANYVLQFEDVVVGSYRGGFARFLRRRLLGRAPKEPPGGAGRPGRTTGHSP